MNGSGIGALWLCRAVHRHFLTTLLLATLPACVGAPPAPATEITANPPTASGASPLVETSFDGERARTHLLYLADPARAGRLTGSRGYAESAEYVAARFREIGLMPMGDDGTYLQRFRTSVVELVDMPRLELTEPAPHRFTLRQDFSELVGGRRGAGTVEAKVVFVGAGTDTAAYSDYRDVDPRGKIVLIAGASQVDPIEVAHRLGAVGALFVTRQQAPLLHYSYIPAFERDALPAVVITEAVADRLIASRGKKIAELRAQVEQTQRRVEAGGADVKELLPISFDTDARLTLSVPLGPVRQVDGHNVVGMLTPALSSGRERSVVIGGHLDGVGVDPDGTVYPGANDNASGVAVTIEAARVLSAERAQLRAGVIFVAFAAEEQGFRGSDYFVQRILNPTQSLVAYVNLDVVGCCGSTLGASDENAALYRRLQAAADRHGIAIAGVSGGGSDHVSFARRGVPAAILAWSDFGGARIHTTADTAAVVDAKHLRDIGTVATQAVLELAAGESRR
jgi:hypothetical protein